MEQLKKYALNLIEEKLAKEVKAQMDTLQSALQTQMKDLET